eukprot:CAMPEP_0171128766 /NCGR_PEP_ID=MMETSP0766_2-20121228/117730_1 /TAXON_ID=439317 /ORGANISM="Gambierdiscus australes, Strain CAWD 149" /LENGTH=82 /DNA_ID=CAMNT_0011591939 /DNA_START=29 /DNA_END=273 /DNA_ORIENTATION=-
MGSAGSGTAPYACWILGTSVPVEPDLDFEKRPKPVKQRVQAIASIDYGPPGCVPQGATGKAVDMNYKGGKGILVCWEAFPML